MTIIEEEVPTGKGALSIEICSEDPGGIAEMASRPEIIRIGICEDSEPDMRILRKYLSEWQAEVNQGKRLTEEVPITLDLKVSEFSDAEGFYFSYPDDPRFDVLLLDIHMSSLDGFQLARSIRDKDPRVAIVFVTGDPDYATRGYDVDASGYIVKPIDRQEFYAIMDKCFLSLRHYKTELIWETDGDLHKIYQEDILYFESDGHMITAVTLYGRFTRRLTWAELETMISPNMFARIHRSYIVGLHHIDVISKDEVILDDGSVLPISRRLGKDLREKFVKFHTEKDRRFF
ncbi:MAG TPA: LytTR family DNA-binding domain-containing protein [Bacillota bacterium]|nr:response regulator transcription factor [Candidatus Fermentithermobacillaceae bacterium]HOK64778.1 LytTR family DNA-binding domain-containing protein [Bacillota bacterium]HOL12309.1 LytTR family DNA-binding domain-containing protein [Bacillota bacterium]HPP61063.1 LytTR family DNA-binding domain-containing protein [Bacillota bacterium]